MLTLCEAPPVSKFLRLMLAALLAATTCLSALCCMPEKAHAEEGDLGSVGYLSYVGPMLEDTPNKNPSGTVALSNHMEITVNGTTLVAICAEHELDTPPLGTAVRKTGTVTNDDIRRVLYYGYKGPQDQGYSVVRTATAVSLANGHMKTSLAQSMIDAVRKLPAPPSNWVVEMWNTDASGDQNLVTGRLVRQQGWLELQKKSSQESMTDDSACYSLENAVYGVFPSKDDAHAGTNAIAELRTNILGYAKSGTLDTGTYFVKETAAPTGMKLDETVYTVSVEHNAIVRVNAASGGIVLDDPLYAQPDMLLQKSDTELLSMPGIPQGEATLAGSVWTAEFYYGYFTSVEEARASGKAMRIWKFVTDEQGIVKLDPAYLTEGSDELWLVDGKPVLPLGTIIWEEERAPEGYLNTAAEHAEATGTPYPYLRTITADGDYSAPDAADDVVRGGVRVQKTDAETRASTSLGAAQLDGARIDIVSANPHPVQVEGALYENGQTVQTLTIVDGWAETSADALPYGSYLVRESMPGNGYELSAVEREFSIRADGAIVELAGAGGIPNQVKRGDVSLVKTSGEGVYVPNVAFRITSQTTGESHIVVTNENGIASTSAEHAPHSVGTNANDGAEPAAYSSSAGVWFGLTPEGSTTHPDDSLGALPFDTYTLEELVCPANSGLQLADPATFTISQHGVTLDLGEIDNPKGSIATNAA
ncbi:MAG: hypothetical protein IJC51_00990, partial [Eggerthellaceae bacterium]|nr:hypothetical protein [Eggerthellaceae bacterium]